MSLLERIAKHTRDERSFAASLHGIDLGGGSGGQAPSYHEQIKANWKARLN